MAETCETDFSCPDDNPIMEEGVLKYQMVKLSSGSLLILAITNILFFPPRDHLNFRISEDLFNKIMIDILVIFIIGTLITAQVRINNEIIRKMGRFCKILEYVVLIIAFLMILLNINHQFEMRNHLWVYVQASIFLIISIIGYRWLKEYEKNMGIHKVDKHDSKEIMSE